MPLISLARLFSLLLALGSFLVLFNPHRHQPFVDALWVAALGFWIYEIRQRGGRSLGIRCTRLDLAVLGAILLPFAAGWLPFYNNWRWAYTGDSIVWFTTAADAAANQMRRNLLSVQGVDGNFTYLHSLGFNGLLFVFEPTFFWHRVGKLIVSCLALATVYTFFTLNLGRPWAIAIVLCTLTNYVWLWLSYISYGHMDGYIFYFATLTAATLIFRYPDRPGGWMLCGLIGGLSLSFTQTSWSAVAAIGLVLAGFALLTRRVTGALVYVCSFLLAGAPIVLQLSGFITMITGQSRSIFEWEYLQRIFLTIIRFPHSSPYHHIGVDGAFLRPPLGDLYVVGAVLAGLGLLPPVRRLLRIPRLAPALLGLVLWDAVLMTLTNNGYNLPSSKRVLNLIPIQIFLALLPAFVAVAWIQRWVWARRVAAIVILAAIAVYARANLETIVDPSKGLYGTNVYDGLIELRQRYPDRAVVLFSSHNRLSGWVKTFLDRAYDLEDTVTEQSSMTSEALAATCDGRTLACYEPNMDGQSFEAMSQPMKERLEPWVLLNSRELRCFACKAV